MQYSYTDRLGEVYSLATLHDLFDEFLDEAYPVVSVAGFDYPVSHTLRTLDEIRYRQGFLDWLDSEVQDGTLTIKVW